MKKLIYEPFYFVFFERLYENQNSFFINSRIETCILAFKEKIKYEY